MAYLKHKNIRGVLSLIIGFLQVYCFIDAELFQQN